MLGLLTALGPTLNTACSGLHHSSGDPSASGFADLTFKLLTMKGTTPCSIREAEGRGPKPRWHDLESS